MAAEPTRTEEADEVELLELEFELRFELDELLVVWEELEPEVELDDPVELDWLADMLELGEAEDDVAEADEPEAEAEDEDDPDEDEAAAAAETILPLPQGIAGPSGCLA